MGESLWIAFALLLILEGLLPFLAPRIWREAFQRLTELTDGQLRAEITRYVGCPSSFNQRLGP